jgi:hypothetical protein
MSISDDNGEVMFHIGFDFSRTQPSLGTTCASHLAWGTSAISQANVLACWLFPKYS